MKKLISIVLSAIMVISILPITAFAKEVESISYQPREDVFAYYETDGEWRPGNDGSPDFFYYFGVVGYGQDDRLFVTYDNGETVEFVGTYENDSFAFVAENGDRITQEQFRTRDDQQQVHWTLGDDNYYYIEYAGKEAAVQVRIIQSEISAVSFTPAKKAVITENTNGEWRWDEEHGDYYSYSPPSFSAGDVLDVTYSENGETVSYTYLDSDFETGRENGFYDSEGKMLPDSNELYTIHHGDDIWEVGSDNNVYYVEYKRVMSNPVYVSLVENPYSKIEFVKKTPVVYYEGSHMHYDDWDDAYYYDTPGFELGDQLIIYDKNGTPSTYTFTYDEYQSQWEGRFVCEGKEDIQRNDVWVFSHQNQTPWSIDGKNYCYVQYAGFEASFYVSIIENPVGSISYSRANNEIMENTHGEYQIDDNEESFYFYWDFGTDTGDVLTVNYTDGRDEVKYTAQVNPENYNIEFVAANGDVIDGNDVHFSSNQRENHWVAGGDNRCTVEYLGRTTEINISIIKNPVERIDFTPKNPAVYTEGQQRYDEWDDAYYYDMPQIRPDDVLTVTYSDKGEVAYTAVYDGERDRTDFVSADGDVIEINDNKDFSFYHWQRECPWTPDGEDNYYFIEYYGISTRVPVTIKANNVKAIKIKTPQTLTLFANEKFIGPDENGAVYEHYNIPDMPDGTILTITDKQGNDKDYVLGFDESDGERWFKNGDEKIHYYEVFVSHNQAQQPWTVGNENYFTASYLGAECQVPVSIIESDVVSISFTKQGPVVFNEYENGEWKFSDKDGRFFEYRVQYGDVGDVLTVNYVNGTTKEYVVKFDVENECAYLEAKDGEKLTTDDVRAYDNQWGEPWGAGRYNCYYISFHGAVAEVPVIIEHVFEKNVVPPTCTEQGYTEYHCTACGEEFTDDYEDPVAHNYVTTTTKATLSKDGSIVKQCTVGKEIVSKTTIYKPTTFTLSKTTYTYNGKVQKPTVTVKDSKGKTVAASNYSLTYSNKNSKAYGKYTVKITFKGNYSGSKTLTYYISPKGTTVSKITSPKSKQLKVTWKKQTSNTNGYQIQIATDSKFTKDVKDFTVTSNKTTSKTLTNLKSKKKYYVRIRTYKTVKGVKCYSTWSGSKTFTTK